MKNSLPIRLLAAIILIAGTVFTFIPGAARAQTQEPDVMPLPEPRTPLSEDKHNTLGARVFINNFGFGLGGQYSRIIGPFTQVYVSVGVTSIRDVSEQNFQDFFTGQQVIPNKFNRALGFPLTVGIKRRLFAQKIDDNFRFFISGGVGPAMAFIFPYLNDIDGNGFRNPIDFGGFVRLEPINDFFTGWDNGETKWGANGEIKIGVDIGDNFSRLTTVEFGYFFYYFSDGIQLMEPRRPVTQNGQVVVNPDGSFQSEPFFDDQSFFGTPLISLIFGGMW